jgi:hypothetical protein
MASKLNTKKYAQVVTLLSPGVAKGAGGWVIINGKLVKIPPRGPANELFSQAMGAVKALGKLR